MACSLPLSPQARLPHPPSSRNKPRPRAGGLPLPRRQWPVVAEPHSSASAHGAGVRSWLSPLPSTLHITPVGQTQDSLNSASPGPASLSGLSGLCWGSGWREVSIGCTLACPSHPGRSQSPVPTEAGAGGGRVSYLSQPSDYNRRRANSGNQRFPSESDGAQPSLLQFFL